MVASLSRLTLAVAVLLASGCAGAIAPAALAPAPAVEAGMATARLDLAHVAMPASGRQVLSLGFGEIHLLCRGRLTVTGPGITTPVSVEVPWFVLNTGVMPTASVDVTFPAGPNRVFKLEGLSADGHVVFQLRGAASVAAGGAVTLRLDPLEDAVARTIEHLMAGPASGDPEDVPDAQGMAARLSHDDLSAALRTFIRAATDYWAPTNTYSGPNPFAFRVRALANALRQQGPGFLSTVPAGVFLTEARANVTFNVVDAHGATAAPGTYMVDVYENQPGPSPLPTLVSDNPIENWPLLTSVSGTAMLPGTHSVEIVNYSQDVTSRWVTVTIPETAGNAPQTFSITAPSAAPVYTKGANIAPTQGEPGLFQNVITLVSDRRRDAAHQLINDVVYFADGTMVKMAKSDGAGHTVVSLVAGAPPGSGSFVNGPGADARFARIYGLALGPDGTLYVSDYGGAIRSITNPATQPMVHTILGGSDGQPAPNPNGYVLGEGSQARFSVATLLACDAQGKLYISDFYNHVLEVASQLPGGGWSTARLAGAAPTADGAQSPDAAAGHADGVGGAASFAYPRWLTCSGETLYVVDGNGALRKVDLVDGRVSTLINADLGYVDGPVGTAQTGWLGSIDVDDRGNLYMLDAYNFAIRRMTPDGVFTTLTRQSALEANRAFARELHRTSGLSLRGDGRLMLTGADAWFLIDPS